MHFQEKNVHMSQNRSFNGILINTTRKVNLILLHVFNIHVHRGDNYVPKAFLMTQKHTMPIYSHNKVGLNYICIS